MEDKATIQALDATLSKVLTYKIVCTIRNHYGTLEAYKAECAKRDNKALARYIKNFHVEESLLQRMTRRNGKRYLKQIIKLHGRSNPQLVYKAKYIKKYESG